MFCYGNQHHLHTNWPTANRKNSEATWISSVCDENLIQHLTIFSILFFFFFPSVVAQKLGEKKTTKKKNKPHTQTTKQKQPPPLKQNKTKKNHEPNKKPPKTKTQTQIHKRWSNSKTKSLISQGSEISSELHDAQEKFKTRHYSVDLTACHTKQFCLHPPGVTYLINKLQAFTGKAWGFSFLLYPDVIVSISPLCYSDLS